MDGKLKAWISTDALIAPISDLNTLFLKVQCPDGSSIVTGATAERIENAARIVRKEFGLDLMPLVLAEIEREHRSTHPYRLRMPADLIAMIEPVPMAAE